MQLIDPKTEQTHKPLEEIIYEAPSIIYEGMISTRAGSTPTDAPAEDEASGVDLFGD
ncbi:MAG: hypothetical protein QNJ45_13745 [Ardenticatenaceae bacterium]|nr:hypothetical protein [Ardenticatenaceae bacterium]